jgi:predicted dehydrogenase
MKHDSRTLGLALWGDNGHPIHNHLPQYPRLRLLAFGAFGTGNTDAIRAAHPQARMCDSFAELLATPGVELVSLSSPRRSEQAGHAIAALAAGIHVYAEKPCATSEADLDRLLAAAAGSAAVFHEMAGTVCDQPYWTMRGLVQGGAIGEVIQILVQKSYPFYDGRPRDEAVDGGLIAQNGVHAMRYIEHITGLRASSIEALQTGLGETRAGSDLKMAASLMGRLNNGGLFSAVANYLNPSGFGSWGNEMVRIWGTKGMVESSDAGKRTRLVVGEKDTGPLDASEAPPDWLTCVIAHAADGTPMPFDLDTELHPTRMVLRAQDKIGQPLSKQPCL